MQADWLSRERLDPAEWRLHPDNFRDIVLRFGRPLVDLFATPQNAHLPGFYTRFQCTGAEGCNALRCRWPPGLLYVFPPIPLIPQVIQKLIVEQAEILLIAPLWPRRPWYVDLVGLSVSPPWTIPLQQSLSARGSSPTQSLNGSG